MNAQPNYARMPGPGDFSPPADPPEHDDTDIRDTLMTSPTFVEEAIGDDTDWRAVAKAVIDRDAMEILRLFDVAVQKYADWHIHQAEQGFTPPQSGEDESDPWRRLERAYGEQFKRTPRPESPKPFDLAGFANGLMSGNSAQIERALGVLK